MMVLLVHQILIIKEDFLMQQMTKDASVARPKTQNPFPLPHYEEKKIPGFFFVKKRAKETIVPPVHVSQEVVDTHLGAKRLVGNIKAWDISHLDPGEETEMVLQGFGHLPIVLWHDPVEAAIKVITSSRIKKRKNKTV
ncbi:MAG: hypothetical protein NTX00_04510 [Candidatus Parcubacteria bacterium]|nr:hypothetical protein [Candidatus Parcubacteria bacterium]